MSEGFTDECGYTCRSCLKGGLRCCLSGTKAYAFIDVVFDLFEKE
jgi:hypothetical protein